MSVNEVVITLPRRRKFRNIVFENPRKRLEESFED
jgi:hypothetical protein